MQFIVWSSLFVCATFAALEPLLQLCTPTAKTTMLRNCTWTLSNFCRGKPQPQFELVSADVCCCIGCSRRSRPVPRSCVQVANALPTLAQLIFSKDDEILTDACWALSYLSDDNGPHNQKIQAVIQSGVCRRLVELLM